MDFDSFVILIKTKDFYKDIADDVQNGLRHQTTADRLLLIGWNKKKIGIFKDELDGKIMKVFVGLRGKTYA